MTSPIVILHLSEEWGGVDLLVTRFSAHLRERQVPHVVVQQRGTRLWEDIEPAVRCAPEDIGSLAEQAKTVFMPSLAKLRQHKAMSWCFPRAKVSTWVVHQLDVITALFPFAAHIMPHVGLRLARALPRMLPRHYCLVEESLRDLLDQQGLFFMDSATRRQFNDVFPALAQHPAPMIPIPSPVAGRVTRRRLAAGPLRVGYLGRMDQMKYSALNPLVEMALAEIARTRPVTLLAITEGPLIGRLQENCRKHGIRLDQRPYMPNEQARALLCNETDLVVAMGTAGLDLAGCGHPVVVIDPAYRRNAPAQERFRFMHENEGFCLGEFRDFAGYEPGLRSFAQCVDMLSREDLGQAEAAHVARNHDPATIFDELVERLEASTMPYERLRSHMQAIDRSFRRLSPRYWLQNLRRTP